LILRNKFLSLVSTQAKIIYFPQQSILLKTQPMFLPDTRQCYGRDPQGQGLLPFVMDTIYTNCSTILSVVAAV